MSHEQEEFTKKATLLACELYEHFNEKAQKLLADEDPSLIGATYQISACYLLATVIKVLRHHNKRDNTIKRVLIESIDEAFQLVDLAAIQPPKSKH